MAPTLYEGVFKKISSIEAFIEKCTVINESRVGIISDAFSATHLGYSAALVAFVIGSILAETKEVHRIVG